MSDSFVACSIKNVPPDKAVEAAERAIEYNPANRPSPGKLIQTINIVLNINSPGASGAAPAPGVGTITVPPAEPTPDHLAVMTTKYWGAAGVKLTVGFPFDSTPMDLQKRILLHMNAWGAYCNVKFALTNTDPQVRIARNNDGYWSYLGTDILSIPRNEPTMNLQGFTMATDEREFHRVVRHETGHTLGFPHEHMRQELVARLDRQKTIAYFLATQGWSAQVTTQQVLTPLSEASIRGTPNADQDSIMCYQLPGLITIDGQPIRGGADIDVLDQGFAAKLYPLPVQPPPPPPPPPPVAFSKTITVKSSDPNTTITVN